MHLGRPAGRWQAGSYTTPLYSELPCDPALAPGIVDVRRGRDRSSTVDFTVLWPAIFPDQRRYQDMPNYGVLSELSGATSSRVRIGSVLSAPAAAVRSSRGDDGRPLRKEVAVSVNSRKRRRYRSPPDPVGPVGLVVALVVLLLVLRHIGLL